MSILVFDIETVPDTRSGNRLYELQDHTNMTAGDIAELMFSRRRQESNGQTDLLRHHLQQVVAVSTLLRDQHGISIRSLGKPEDSEETLVRDFFTLLETHTPTLVSWNGGGFDLPVLQYRALLYGIQAPRYWENGNRDPDFRWNNYMNRYHERHTDLMDILSGHQRAARAKLHEIAIMLGLPGKMGITGDQVWECYQQQKLHTIRNYCETDVLNTYLIYLRFRFIQSRINADRYERECDTLAELLKEAKAQHLQDFFKAWRG